MTKNASVLAWIDEMKALVNPDQVVWINGTEEQLDELRAEACKTGEMIKLNQEKLPGCYLPPHGCERRGPCGRQNFHLLSHQGRSWPHQQLDGPAGSL